MPIYYFLQDVSFVFFCFRETLESDGEFEIEGDVPVPRPLSPEPGPSTTPEERRLRPGALTGKQDNYNFISSITWEISCFSHRLLTEFP